MSPATLHLFPVSARSSVVRCFGGEDKGLNIWNRILGVLYYIPRRDPAPRPAEPTVEARKLEHQYPHDLKVKYRGFQH